MRAYLGRTAAPSNTIKTPAAAVAVVLGLAACGGSPAGPGAASARSASTPPASSSSSGSSSSNSSGSSALQALAFSHCMRRHGVPNFPDPNSSGVWPKSQVELVATNPEFQAATRACGPLLPDGGPGVPPSPAVVQQIGSDMVKFARCMRSHGVANWPGPTLDRGRAIFDPQAVGIDANSPQISTKMHQCQHVFPAALGLPPGA